jgi:eukaryotic-like serine/threonine-protein kinase
MQEALAWIRLDVHPNVAQARMIETIAGKPFLFLEYVNGGDLGTWIGTPRLTEDLPQVLRFAIQCCDGMVHAYAKGVSAHRDIKPRNCLITHDGVLKVTDFGLAKLFDQDTIADVIAHTGPAANFNLTATAVGTCTHMAPEQFVNARLVDVRVDIYAFGVMLYQMIQGELPFSGQNWKELEHLHKTQPPPLLTNTDESVATLVQKCLAKDPAHRYSGFDEVRFLLSGMYEKIVGTPPPEPLEGAALNAAQWSNKGSSLDNLGRRSEAIASYDVALKLDPTLMPAWFNKGVALYATKHVPEALTCYDHALKLNPTSEQVWSNKGVALKAIGKHQEALACYDRAIECNPRYPNAWVNKGVALRALGKVEEALACYNQALRLDPSDQNAWTNKGNALYVLQKMEEATVCYDRALSLNSSLELAWLNKGLALGALGRHELALQCYDMVLELKPAVEQAWYLRGVTMINGLHLYREAVPYLEEAERLGVAEAKHALAVCRSAVGAN